MFQSWGYLLLGAWVFVWGYSGFANNIDAKDNSSTNTYQMDLTNKDQ